MKPANYRIILRKKIHKFISTFDQNQQSRLWNIVNEYEDDLENVHINKNLEFILDILQILKNQNTN